LQNSYAQCKKDLSKLLGKIWELLRYINPDRDYAEIIADNVLRESGTTFGGIDYLLEQIYQNFDGKNSAVNKKIDELELARKSLLRKLKDIQDNLDTQSYWKNQRGR